VTLYNTAIVVFPSSIVANSKRLVKADFFEAEEAKRADVEMRF
jgi:LemA protein